MCVFIAIMVNEQTITFDANHLSNNGNRCVNAHSLAQINTFSTTGRSVLSLGSILSLCLSDCVFRLSFCLRTKNKKKMYAHACAPIAFIQYNNICSQMNIGIVLI